MNNVDNRSITMMVVVLVHRSPAVSVHYCVSNRLFDNCDRVVKYRARLPLNNLLQHPMSNEDRLSDSTICAAPAQVRHPLTVSTLPGQICPNNAMTYAYFFICIHRKFDRVVVKSID